MADRPTPSKLPLKSTLANDPELGELVAMFVADLGQRAEAIRSAMDGQRVQDIRRLSHQLRGSSASFGLRRIGDAAAKVEDAIKVMEASASVGVEGIRAEVDELIGLCERAAKS